MVPTHTLKFLIILSISITLFSTHLRNFLPVVIVMPKAGNMKGYNTPSLLQCIIFCVISVALLYWVVIGLSPSQEPMLPSDFLHCFVCLLMYLCSKSVFLLLLCNVIIGALWILSKSTESHGFCRPYLNQREARKKQELVAEPLWIEKKSYIHEHGVADINVRKPGIGGCVYCSEETKSNMWVSSSSSSSSSSMAVVPYAEISNEELNRKCDEFIAGFHGLCRPYINQSEAGKKQEVVAEPLRIGKKSYIHEHGVADINVKKIGIGCGDCCSEETKSNMWVSSSSSSMAVVSYTDISNEELNRKCGEFIAHFRRQMSLQSRST